VHPSRSSKRRPKIGEPGENGLLARTSRGNVVQRKNPTLAGGRGSSGENRTLEMSQNRDRETTYKLISCSIFRKSEEEISNWNLSIRNCQVSKDSSRLSSLKAVKFPKYRVNGTDDITSKRVHTRWPLIRSIRRDVRGSAGSEKLLAAENGARLSSERSCETLARPSEESRTRDIARRIYVWHGTARHGTAARLICQHQGHLTVL